MPGNTVAEATIEVALVQWSLTRRGFVSLRLSRALKRTAKFKEPLTRQRVETKPGFMHGLQLS
jgi:hypothetical protein